MAQEFDLDQYPGNPRLMDTYKDFCARQRRFILATKWPPGTKFECHRCGECCTWNYCNFKVPAETLELVKRDGAPFPHGHWVVLADRLRLFLPMKVSENEYKEFIFSGMLPPSHMEFLKVTGRFHGYWVLNENDRIIVYSPVKCVHLTKDNLCGIHGNHPRICQKYICGRYPITP